MAELSQGSRRGRPSEVLIIVCAGVVLASLDLFIVNVALPDIARDLGKRTVAEFVAEPEILEVCRDEGVDFAQGYLIGKPVPFDEFVREFVSSAVATASND